MLIASTEAEQKGGRERKKTELSSKPAENLKAVRIPSI
jgi:hypothetical protein